MDPATGISYLQTSVDITKDRVEDQFGEEDYQCECHAWNNVPNFKPLLTRSSKATIHVACECTDIVLILLHTAIENINWCVHLSAVALRPSSLRLQSAAPLPGPVARTQILLEKVK